MAAIYAEVILAVGQGKNLAKGLQSGSPGGLLHLRAISAIVGRCLKIIDEKYGILYQFGKEMQAKGTIELIYKKGKNIVGHWYLPGNLESKDTINQKYDCLFDVIALETNLASEQIRLRTSEKLKNLAWVYEEVHHPDPKCWLLLGGARYTGSSAHDAGSVIDRSHGTVGHAHVRKAHPRGHASHPSGVGNEDSVENYSHQGMKSGWLSRNDQNSALHELLSQPEAANAMNFLNNGSTRESFTVTPQNEIFMGEWLNGIMVEGPLRARSVTVVLQHHQNEQNNSNADVQVFTCFPRK